MKGAAIGVREIVQNISAYTLFSGSSGNSCYVSCKGESILIDAGVSCMRLSAALASLGADIKSIKAIFITHEHTDHVKGLDMISKKYRIPIFCTKYVALAIAAQSTYSRDMIHIIEPDDTVYLENMTVSASKVPHDSADNVCYRITMDGAELGYATDIGRLTKRVAETLCGCRYVVVESNHDIAMLNNGPYPQYLKQRILSDGGHLSNDDCARLVPYLVSHGCRYVVLAHLSGENNTPELAVACCKAALEENEMAGEATVAVALPDRPVKII